MPNAPEPPDARDYQGEAAVPSTARSWGAAAVVALSVLGSVAAGAAELAARFGLRRISPQIDKTFYLDPQAAWMAPLVNLPIFLAAIGLTSALLRESDRRARWMVSVAAALVVLEVALVTRRIWMAALVLLSVGIGTQVSAVAMRWRAGVRLRLPLAAAIAAGLTVAAGAGWNLHLWLDERRQLAAVPPPADAPNVLLLILDTVRAWDLDAYGYHLPTAPTLARLAAEGIRFERAIAPAPWTLPSHASMFTGRWPNELSVGWYARLDRSAPTLAERMTEAGYATGGFVGNLIYTTYLYGLNRGFMHYKDYSLTPGQLLASTTLGRELESQWRAWRGRYRDPWHKDGRFVTDEFLAWQEGLGSRPFFAFLNYFDAHGPYQPPAPYDTLFLGREPRTRRESFATYPDSDTIRDLRLAYDGGIRYADAQVGRLLSELARRGVLDHTIVIVTADHGESFGEQDMLGHGGSVFLSQIHVPLLVALPGRPIRGMVVKDPVSLRDLAATILDVTGARGRSLPGRSLARFWHPASDTGPVMPPASPVYSETGRLEEFQARYPASRGDLQSIIRGPWHFVRSTGGEEGLYQFLLDSLETHNRVADPGLAATVDSLRAELDALRRP